MRSITSTCNFYIDNKMSVCSLLLRENGDQEELQCAHEEVHSKLGGKITFVGGIPTVNTFVVGLKDAETLPINTFCLNEDIFMELPVKGPVVFVATDEDGEPVDVDIAYVKHLLIRKHPPHESV